MSHDQTSHETRLEGDLIGIIMLDKMVHKQWQRVRSNLAFKFARSSTESSLHTSTTTSIIPSQSERASPQ
eukprot:6489443-Amphidinium_carterae.1